MVREQAVHGETAEAMDVDGVRVLEADGKGRKLAKCLNDADPAVRRAAAEALARLRAGAAIVGLTERLALDDDPLVRAAAADALGQIGGAAVRLHAGPRLSRSVYDDPDPSVRTSAADALIRIRR